MLSGVWRWGVRECSGLPIFFFFTKENWICAMTIIWNKEKDLDKVVWVNQIVLFLQSFCFTIELLAFQANNVKLCRSRRYCSCLTHFGSIFFMPPKNMKNLWFSNVSKGYKKLSLTSTGLILVVYRNCNVLQSFCFETYWLGK